MVRFGRGMVAVSVLAAGIIGMGIGGAQANLTAVFAGSTLAGGGSDWTYDVRLDTTQNVNNTTGFANFVTIYDFGLAGTVSFNPSSMTGLLFSQGWAGAFSATNAAAVGTTPTDLANLVNFRLTAPVATIILGIGQSIGTFTLHSTFATLDQRTVSTDGQAFQTSAPAGQHGNIGSTVAPVPGPILGSGIPGLILACSSLIALVRRRRRRAMA
jgi:hypothetical protein